MFDLGYDGTEAPRRAAETTDFLAGKSLRGMALLLLLLVCLACLSGC